jgi:hypothetical protein
VSTAAASSVVPSVERYWFMESLLEEDSDKGSPSAAVGRSSGALIG